MEATPCLCLGEGAGPLLLPRWCKAGAAGIPGSWIQPAVPGYPIAVTMVPYHIAQHGHDGFTPPYNNPPGYQNHRAELRVDREAHVVPLRVCLDTCVGTYRDKSREIYCVCTHRDTCRKIYCICTYRDKYRGIYCIHTYRDKYRGLYIAMGTCTRVHGEYAHPQAEMGRIARLPSTIPPVLLLNKAQTPRGELKMEPKFP